MAPLAQILALLAMAVTISGISKVPLDTARYSFDDQYLTCAHNITMMLPHLKSIEIDQNDEIKKFWSNATAEWRKRGRLLGDLSEDEAIAVMMYTVGEVHNQFNQAVHDAGYSYRQYRKYFPFKMLHFLLTRALQKLRTTCQDVFRGVAGKQFRVNLGDEVRFGQFTSTSLSFKVAEWFGRDTMFHVHTCHGASIEKYAFNYSQREVLIPPFEKFEVTYVSPDHLSSRTQVIKLKSKEDMSNHKCQWLPGGSLPRTSPNLWGILLAIVVMAVVTGSP